MEITKSLQDDIVKIQNELITAIQNHQVLVLRQQVNPTESIKTQIEEVQRHIICLGESQKILVNRLRNELEPQSLRVSNKHKPFLHQQPYIKSTENNKFSNKLKSQDLGRSLLVQNINHRERALLKTNQTSDSDNISDRNNLFPKECQPSVDSSSEENRTPCESPINGNSDSEQKRAVKRSFTEVPYHHNKRVKSTLQATPRPSSPVPSRNKNLDALSSSSEESLDSLLSQQPESESKVDFALALGLITNEVYNKVIKKKSERRRRRRVSSQHHLYDDLWDLTVLQKRSRLKEPEPEDADDASRDCTTPQSDSDSLCFVCRRPGELRECCVCHTGCHPSCITNNVCPACTHQACANPLIAEKKKELEQLKVNNKELLKSVSKLRERAKVLSASLVMQTATVNQLVAKEDKLHESIKKLKDFVACIQGSPKSTS